jgi:transglutaminase-like putative cysteine protease
MDLIAFAAIYASSEVKLWPFGVAAALMAIRYTSRFRFRAIWMVTGFLLFLFLGFQLTLRIPLHPLVSAAHVAPIAMAWIGLSRGSEDFWGWRMGLAFISLILASALSPDFSVTLLIVAFIVGGSIGISCRFLAEEFIRRGVVGTLPHGFIRNSFKQTGILFLAALIIFPLIPRVQGRGTGGFGNEPSKTGYTEDVNLSEWSRVSGRGSNAPALRIYGPSGLDPNDYIPAGLLRSRVLSILGVNRWDPSPVKLASVVADTTQGYGTLQIVREMIGPAYLPVPYGTLQTQVEAYGYRWGAEKTVTSEWREARSRNQRFTYHTTVGGPESWRAQDTPTAVESRVPDKYRTERMTALAARLFKGLKDPEAKVRAIQGYFMREGFRAVYAEDEVASKDELADQNLPPIERFMFVEKNGHCELFASSMAILLRLGGVPTRLIAGFRVNRNAIGDVLTVRQADAHAWLEAYLPGIGWRPYDPTPKTLRALALTDWIRDSYDWASAKWTQYILNYGEGESSVRAQWDAVKRLATSIATGENPFKDSESDATTYLFFALFILAAGAASTGAIALIRSLLRREKARTESAWVRTLMRERGRFESVLKKSGRRSGGQISESEIRRWYESYEKARFGLVVPENQSLVLAELRSHAQEIGRSAKLG